MKTAFAWFVIVSGIYDLLLGAGLLATARSAAPATWLMTVTLGGFLVFAGAVLVWAAQDLQRRGSVVLWQGLVRLLAASATFYGISHGLLPAESIARTRIAAWIDIVAALVYTIGLLIVWKLSPAHLLLGRTATETIQKASRTRL